MPLSVGDKLGPYEILAAIGAGGMGQVYKARDTRLGRDVAIKVSSEKFTDRFEREARSIAALNHPNICHLYDVGPNYLVMELIDGRTLKGPLPVEKALDYARQILDALDAAHSKNITHRDLKPANVLVTKNGIKLLDFGLVKQSAPLKETDATEALTQQGAIVGTLNYMSPEQLQSKEADARSDIFSFGLVLYELVTGKVAFEAANVASLIAAILDRPAPSIAEIAPPALDRILTRCLAKNPADRWQSARDLRAALDLPTGVANHIPVRQPFVWMIAAALFAAIAVLALWAPWRSPPPATSAPMRFTVDLGPDALPSPRITAAISPDGMRLAFVARGSNGTPQLATRRLDQGKSAVLAGTENAVDPFFSPDSQWIGFFADKKMKKVSVDGGAAVELCDAFDARGAWWGEDGNIIFTPISSTGGLSRVSASGGTPEILTRPSAAEVSHRWPQILPGGEAVLFSSTAIIGNYENGVIELLSLKTGQWKRVYSRGYFGRYLPASKGAGYLVFAHQGTMFGAPFDLKKMEVTGTPTPLVDRIAASTFFGSGQFEVSSNGTLIYAAGDASAAGSIVLINRAGEVSSPLPFAAYYGPRFSPEGKLLAGQVDNDVQVYDLERNRLTRVTLDRINSAPIWTADAAARRHHRARRGSGGGGHRAGSVGLHPGHLHRAGDPGDLLRRWRDHRAGRQLFQHGDRGVAGGLRDLSRGGGPLADRVPPARGGRGHCRIRLHQPGRPVRRDRVRPPAAALSRRLGRALVRAVSLAHRHPGHDDRPSHRRGHGGAGGLGWSGGLPSARRAVAAAEHRARRVGGGARQNPREAGPAPSLDRPRHPPGSHAARHSGGRVGRGASGRPRSSPARRPASGSPPLPGIACRPPPHPRACSAWPPSGPRPCRATPRRS